MSAPVAAGHDTQRVFLALWPDNAVRRRIDAHARRWTFDTRSRRYAPADWHVTLHFLGAVRTTQLPAIADGVALPVEPFELVLDRPQLWPGGLAVVGVAQVPQPLRDLHARLAGALQALQQDVDTRPYRPHLTLARHAGRSVAPRVSAPIVWPVHAYALVVSTGDVRARYAMVRRYA